MWAPFRYILISLLILTQFSCGKEDFTEPSPTSFSFILTGASENIDHLSFSKIQLLITEFEFEGVRQNAPDFFFEEVFDEQLNLQWPAVVTSLDFEIPQGVYETVEISFRLSESSESVMVEGIYRSLERDRNILLSAELGEAIALELSAVHTDGSTSISFDKGTVNRASIQFDATGLFATIDRERMESAVGQLAENEILTISNSINTDIYQILKSQLMNYISITFE